ncbi:MAG: sulfotransferase [Proteobacteria bacterium]|nr:sulfotransferase [Pseudomonadota bacterium]
MIQGAIARAPPVQFTLQAVLGAARAATGLKDFGRLDFLERLEVWLAAFEADKGLNPLGRAGLFADCVRQASTRLRFEDAWRRHPEIAGVAIDRPIMIAGLPRSGTTHLVNLIAADPRLRSLPLWESMEPVARSEPPPPPAEDPRRADCIAMWGGFEALLPLMPAMHEMAPDGVHEDVELLGPDFSGYLSEWVSRPYGWRDYYLGHDQTPHYAYAKRLLQYLTWLRGPNRWVLKSPPHMENLGALNAVYPDATVVITHRDPLAVLQSAITMIAYGDRIRRKVDLAELATYWTDRIEALLRRCVEQRHLVPRAIDVRFDEYMADQMGTIERVYAQAGLALTGEARGRIEAHLAANPRGKHGQVAYDLRGDFGLDPDALWQRFAFYTDHFGVRREVW